MYVCMYVCTDFSLSLSLSLSVVVILYLSIYLDQSVCLSVWFSLVSLFNGISTLFRLFNAKAILLEEQ